MAALVRDPVVPYLYSDAGIVSTAFIADATPAAFTAHTADRGQYPHVVDTFLNGLTDVSASSDDISKRLVCQAHV